MKSLSDAELERLAAGGSRDAFGELYERHSKRVYDFLLRLTQDPDEAADLMQETFVRAMKSLSSEKAGGAPFSTWLFTIARNLAVTRLERRKRTVPLVAGEDEREAEGSPAFRVVDEDRFADPAEATGAKETAGLVWQAAAALNPKEYSLLDLHVRQGLDSAEIASVLGVSKGNAYTMLSRLKGTFEEAVATLVMFKRGRRYCLELDRVISDHRIHEVSVSARKLISRHTAECETCREQRRRLVSAEAVLRALVPLPVPLFLKQRIAQAAFGHGVATAGGAANAGAGKPLWQQATGASTGTKATAAVLIAFVAAASIAAWVIAQGESSGGQPLTMAATPTFVHEWAAAAITARPTATVTPTPTPTPAPMPALAASSSVALAAVVLAPSEQPPPTSTPVPAVAPAPPPAPCAGVPPFPPSKLPDGYAPSDIVPEPGLTAGFNGQLEQSIAELENYYRGTLGLGPLEQESRLDRMARVTAKQLVEAGWLGTNFMPDHIGPDGRDLSQRLADVGLARGQNVYWASENYYWGINGANAGRMFSQLSDYHLRDIAADCLYGAPKGPYYGIGCYFLYSPQMQFVCIVDYAAFQ